MLLWLLAASSAMFAISFGNLSFSYGLAAARRALHEGNASLALSVLETLADRGAQSPEWQLLRIRALSSAGYLADAEKLLAEAQASGWDPADLKREALLLKARRGDVKKVEPQLVELLAAGASDEIAEEVYEAMAQGYWASYHAGEALECLDFWRRWQPQNLVPRLWIAEIYERTERPDQAIAEYREILELDPKRTDLLAKVGDLLLKKRELAEATDAFERCLASSPESADALLGLAECRRRQSLNDEVKDLLYDALTLDLSPSQVGRALGILGALALEDREHARAVWLLHESIQVDSNEPATHTSLAAALAALGQTELAATERQHARDTSDRRSRLVRTTRKVLEEPANPDLRCEVGLIRFEQGVWDEGADWLKTALEIDPQHRAAHEGLVKYYEHVGDLEQAQRHRSLAEQAPKEVPPADSRDR
jgi:Tfp pilus assembly protein PilF